MVDSVLAGATSVSASPTGTDETRWVATVIAWLVDVLVVVVPVVVSTSFQPLGTPEIVSVSVSSLSCATTDTDSGIDSALAVSVGVASATVTVGGSVNSAVE